MFWKPIGECPRGAFSASPGISELGGNLGAFLAGDYRANLSVRTISCKTGCAARACASGAMNTI